MICQVAYLNRGKYGSLAVVRTVRPSNLQLTYSGPQVLHIVYIHKILSNADLKAFTRLLISIQLWYPQASFDVCLPF